MNLPHALPPTTVWTDYHIAAQQAKAVRLKLDVLPQSDARWWGLHELWRAKMIAADTAFEAAHIAAIKEMTRRSA